MKDNNGEISSRKMVQKVSFYKLFRFADSKDIILMFIGSFSGIANGITVPLSTLLLGHIINSFGSSHPKHVLHHVSKVSLSFVYLAIYTGIFCYLQVTCWIVTGERQAARIRGLYLKTILKQDIAFFDTQTTTGEVVGRMSRDTILIQEAIGEKVGKFIQWTSAFVGGVVIAFIKGWKLALVLMACIPALVVTGVVLTKAVIKMSSLTQTAYAKAEDVVEQTVSTIRTVASFTGQKDAVTKYENKLGIAYKAAIKQSVASGLGHGTIIFINFFTYALAVWYGGRMIAEKGYNGGQVFSVVMALMAGAMSLGQAPPCLNAFAAGQAAAYKMFEAIHRTPEIDSSSNDGIVLDDIMGEIELRDVHFRYPSRPDVEIFAGFSLQIPSGTTTALVGQSGSGKSTVFSLIERFYDPDSGEVLIDGVNLKQLNLSFIRHKIGLVSQEPVLFTTSLLENIVYGKEGATDMEIRTALELANASKFVDKLPEGLNTMVGERGTQLSGGQKQRIAIARAILKRPRILLLDEATSALDAESELVVQDTISRVMSDWTVIIVAHRLTTIRNADMIAVVHKGKIIEKDSHEELIKDPEGAYSQLVRLQEGAKEIDAALMDPSNLDMSPNVGRTKRRSASEDFSMRRLRIRDSSTGRHSDPFSFSVTGPASIQHETNEGSPCHSNDDDHEKAKASSEEEKSDTSRSVYMRRLICLNKPEIPILLLGSLLAAARGMISPLVAYLISSAIKMFYEPEHLLLKDTRKWAIVFICFGVVSLILGPLQSFCFATAGENLIRRVRLITFEKIVHQESKWFDEPKNSSGALGARLSTDAANVRSLVGDQLALLVQNTSTVIAALLIAIITNWVLAFIILAVTPLIFIQGYLQGKYMKGFSRDAKLMYEEASQVANDAVGSIRTVASFCAEKKVMSLYEKKCRVPVKNGVRSGIISGLAFSLSFFALYCTNAFCFYMGAVLIHHRKATFSDVFKVFFALTMSAASLSQSRSTAIDRNKAKDSAVSIFNIVDSKPSIDSSSDEGITQESVKGDIEFCRVSFRYPARPDIQIFTGLSLFIPSCKTFALVGESGSGKSTIISMIERFYEPDKGQVLLDGVELQRFKLSWLREQMGLVSQEPILFNDTIRANIAYAKQGNATENEIIEAATSANAHNFISGLPQGYNHLVGERGVQLSGGQKQRIAIARAIIKNPKILLLDEATSALDAESERIVQDALDVVMIDRTTVIVAHRLGTIRRADTIALLKNGVIAEKGTHDQLMGITHGLYASLVASSAASTL